MFGFMDSMRNVVTRLGTERDKGASNRHFYQELTDSEIHAAYTSSWLAKQIVDIPAEDATKKWRTWNGTPAQIDKLAEVERRLKVQAKIKQVSQWARRDGGAALMIGAGSENFEEPLSLDDVGRSGLQFLVPFQKHELTPGPAVVDLRSDDFGKPETYMLALAQGGTFTVHRSRLIILEGDERPYRVLSSGIEGMQYGWGLSVLQSRIEAVRGFDATMASLLALVSEAKTDIIKIPDLTQKIVDPRFQDKLVKRLQVAKDLQGIHGIMALDGDEEYQVATYQFGGFGELIDRQM